MSEQEFRELVSSLIEEEVRHADGERVRVRSFAEAGVMTSNEGFVVRVDGREFQVTVVRS